MNTTFPSLPPVGWVWLGYGVLGFYFLLSDNLQRKRALVRPYIIGTGVLFVLFAALMGASFRELIPIALLSSGMTYINLRRAPRFCDRCGRTAWTPVPFTKLTECGQCGARLEPRKK